ncbi:motility associated factor glycosyltransferase family protein [Helicobacter cholecystus]|uniref:motility associated factor glycosyltransferase family protein n=1 Tax=Helicobacter cholecystus TaxID=45498 RepID=UPI002738E16E|nr:motility associated factor glycosyltransferase family protein [Helicobacter cholecystus]
MKDFFQSNLASIAIKNPALALLLQAHKPNQSFEVFMGEDIANYNIFDCKREKPLYLTSPLEENMKRFEELSEYAYYPYMYFYGIGNGVLYKLLLGNEIVKRIVVIEPELEILFIAMHFIDFSSEILEGKLVLLWGEKVDYQAVLNLFDQDKHSKLYAKTYMLEACSAYYYENHDEELHALNLHFIKAIEHMVVSVGNDAHDAIVGIDHHIQNLPASLHSPSLVELITQLRGRDTAIIVATGPSLYKQLPLLKEIAPYATLFCIDASFPILHKHGIKPDVVLSLERVEATAKFYEDTPKEAFEGVVFALTSIVHPRLKKAVEEKGGLIQYSFRPFGYTTYFGINEYGYIGIGMSAANMAYEMVVHSRFKRCIIIGQDLAFGEDGSSHSQDALYGSHEIKPKDQKVFVTKYGGGGEIESTIVWRMFLNFYERDIANTPYNLEVINSTEGGARIEGTQEIPFAKAISLIPRESKPKLILNFPTQELIEQNMQTISKRCKMWLREGRTKQKRIEKVFLKVAEFCEELEKLNDENKLETIDYKRMDKLSQEIEKVKEYFKDPIFSATFIDALQSYIFHQEMDIAKVLVRNTSDEMQRRAKQIELIFLHKYWLFSLAGGMDSVLEVVKRASKSWGRGK